MTPSNQLALERLDLAISRIQKGWTKGADARDSLGRRVYPYEPRAVCWCLQGALGLFSPVFEDEIQKIPASEIILPRIMKKIFDSDRSFSFEYICYHIAQWNDNASRIRSEVLQLLQDVRADILAEEGGTSP